MSFDLVLFGGTGDLAWRKLMPALFQAFRHGTLPTGGRIIAVARDDLSDEQYRSLIQSRFDSVDLAKRPSAEEFAQFAALLQYLRMDLSKTEDYQRLAELLNARGADSVVMYVATAPSLFTNVCEQIAAVGLNGPTTRVVLEKPLGTDLKSSQEINAAVGAFYQEDQIYRIDHYLGKEALQNLLALRFANVVFEPLWNNKYVKSVQLTIAEELGVEERGEFYDITGALRDMVQNHLMQMLCMTAMEAPASLDPDAVRDEKLKVVKSLKPLTSADVDENVVRGQYIAGEKEGKALAGYLNEHQVPAGSHTETYVAIKAEIDNARWAGVPFYLRTGKRMAGKVAEIVLNFRDLDSHIFEGSHAAPNRLVIELQPTESIRLYTQVKTPGAGNHVETAALSLDLGKAVAGRRAEAYERLLLDVINGKLALFNRRDELEAAWEWVMPIMENWAQSPTPPHGYAAHSWGPEAARELLARNGDQWHGAQ